MGRELFFLKDDKVMAVALDAQNNPVDRERVILDAPKWEDLRFQGVRGSYFDVMPDGDHFMMVLNPQYPSPTNYNIVVNWFDELK